MTDSQDESIDPLDSILDEFVAQCRLGLSPRISDFQERYPAFADRIAALFPMLAKIESVHHIDPIPENQAPFSNAFSNTVPVGSVIGDYAIEREIGRGGMGVVYLATQLSLGRKVALKVMLPSHVLSRDSFPRFQAESRIASRLHHPHIVPVHNVGIENGIHYFAMQFIDGQSLNVLLENWRRERTRREGLQDVSIDGAALTVTNWARPSMTDSTVVIDNQPVPNLVVRKDWRQVVQWMIQASDAVQYAHSSGVLHRDIKPSNLILDRDGAIWLTDFGLAKTVNEATLTGTGGVAGTLRYLAPERFSGKLDATSDVYSLGTTLYELLILSPPFAAAEQGHLVGQIEKGNFAHPRLLDPSIPRDLDTIICTAMALQPKDRYDSAGSLAEDLRRLLADRPILAHRLNHFEQTWRWARQNKSLAAISLAAILLVLSITMITSLNAVNLARAQKTSENNLAGWERASHDADTNHVRELILDARRIATTVQPGQRFKAIRKLKEAVELAKKLPNNGSLFDDIHCEAVSIYSLSDFDFGESWPIEPNHEDARYCIDSDHRRYAVATKQGHVGIYECGTGKLLFSLPQMQNVAEFAFSPDGNYLAIGFERVDGLRFRVQCWDIRPEPQMVWTAEDLGFARCQWHQSKAELYLTRFDGSIVAKQADSGDVVYHIAPSGPLREVELSPHPFLPIVAVSSYFYHEVQIRSLETGDILYRNTPESYPRGVQWHPAGNEFLISQSSGILEMFAWPQPRSIKRIALYWPGLQSKYSPDGNHLLIHGWDNGVLIRNVDTEQTYLLRGSNNSNNNALSWSRDGRYAGLIAMNGMMRRLQFEESKEFSIYPDPAPNKPGVIFPPLQHPQIDFALFASSEGDSSFFEASSGRLIDGDRRGLVGRIMGWDKDGGMISIDEQSQTQIHYTMNLTKRKTLLFVPKTETSLPITPAHSQLSADSNWMAANYGARQVVWWPRENPEQMASFLTSEGVEVQAISHDGRYIYLRTNLGGVSILDSVERKILVDFHSDNFITASGDDSLIFVSPSNRVMKSGTWEVVLDLPDEPTTGAISPTGKLLAFVDHERYIGLVDLASKQSLVCFEANPKSPLCRSVKFSQDEKQLYIVASGSKENFLQSVNLQRLFASLSDLGTNIHWSQRAHEFESLNPEATERLVLRKLDIRTHGNLRFSQNPYLQYHFDRLRLWTQMRLHASTNPSQCANNLRLAMNVADWNVASQCLAEAMNSGQATELQICLAGALDVQLENWEQAISHFTRCLASSPRSFHARMGRAYALWQQGHIEAALQDLEALESDDMQAFGDELKWRFFQSRLYHELGDDQAERASFEKSAQSASSHFAHSLDRWSWEILYGRVEQCWPKLAEAMSEMACHLAPEIHEHKLTLAVIQMRIGNPNSAQYLLHEYADSNHRSADAWAFHVQALLHRLTNNETEHAENLRMAMANRQMMDISIGFPTSSEFETIIRRVTSRYRDRHEDHPALHAYNLLQGLTQYSTSSAVK